MRVKQIITRNVGELTGELTQKPTEVLTEPLSAKLAELKAIEPNLLLVFGAVEHFTAMPLHQTLRNAFPDAHLIGCSTAGEITSQGVEEGSCTITALHFDKVELIQAATRLAGMDDSYGAGQRIGEQLAAVNLKSVLVFGPGVKINGSGLVNGIASVIGRHPDYRWIGR